MNIQIICLSVNGGFGPWGPWSKCSKKCGGGVKTRSRKCDHPKPKAGGKPCVGSATEQAKCNTKACAGIVK